MCRRHRQKGARRHRPKCAWPLAAAVAPVSWMEARGMGCLSRRHLPVRIARRIRLASRGSRFGWRPTDAVDVPTFHVWCMGVWLYTPPRSRFLVQSLVGDHEGATAPTVLIPFSPSPLPPWMPCALAGLVPTGRSVALRGRDAGEDERSPSWTPMSASCRRAPLRLRGGGAHGRWLGKGSDAWLAGPALSRAVGRLLVRFARGGERGGDGSQRSLAEGGGSCCGR